MTEIQNVDAGKKVDSDRIVGLGVVGLLWKRHAIITVIKYSDDTSEPQTIALDFEHNTNMPNLLLTEKCVRFRIHLVKKILKRQYQLPTN